MSESIRASRVPFLLRLLALGCALVASSLSAAEAPAPIPRSQNVTINLVRRLVQRGLLPQEDADELIKMAEQDAAAARAESAATQAAIARLSGAPSPAASIATAAPMAAPAAAPAEPVADDTVRVTYVPEIVKRQLREEVKQEVLAQAREERWAAPRSFPEWVSRYTLLGDLRLREEGIFYPSGNDNTGAFPNFNAINTGSPFDVAGALFSPQNNVDRDRQRTRLRARFGADVDMGEGFRAGARVATGESNSPVTTNQSLGASGGNFSKYALWLDRAFITYRSGGDNGPGTTVSLGRFDNPFFSSQLVFDDDLGFDGVAARTVLAGSDRVKPFATFGAFPVFNSSLNFSSIQPSKFKSQDKWLLAAQIGAGFEPGRGLSLKIAAAYYYFQNVEGKLSRPFTPLSTADNGNTDETRPSFAQTGNTYFPLRNIVPNVLNNFGTINQFQYFGLATPFHDVAVTGRIDYNRFEPVQVSLLGEWVNNLAFHRGSMRRRAVNNLGAGGVGDFAGGNNGWNVELKVGAAALTQRGDWSAMLGYRSLESDAVVDGFTDSDFGNGGTNLEGYMLGGSLALSRRTWVTLRWLSSSSIAGPRYKNDILQFDFNGKF
jgi:hypothetical protein